MALVAKRYAKALFELNAGDLAKAKKERDSLSALKELFAQKDAGRILRSPVMPPSLKKKLLDYGLSGTPASTEVKNFVDSVLGAGRVAMLPEIADAYAQFIDEAEGRVSADVTTAVALTADDEKAIAETLGRLLKKAVDVKQHVDPAILGGFVAKVGNYRIDLSLKTRLDGLASTAVQSSVR